MRHLITLCALVGAAASLVAQSSAPRVEVTDKGAHTSIAGPGAPRHIVGLPRVAHTILMDTGVRTYGLQYTVAHDPKRPDIAIPGEGYIGMPRPANCNWYAGGFLDLWINGKSIGSTPVHSFLGRSVGSRGQVDFVFDTAASLVRIRFVALAGGDALYCQVLLEPKSEIKDLQVRLRCYPSAFVSNAERHVLTPTRDLAQGKQANLDPAEEGWLLYYDRIFDAGYVGKSRTGLGPCSVLWPAGQPDKVAFTVAAYGITTVMTFKSGRRDLRFVFFDYKGTKNKTAIADLRRRAAALQRQLSTFSFVDKGIADWPLARKRQEIAQILATMPDEKEAAARYRTWAAELAGQLDLVRTGGPGAIMAEATAAKLIREWERGIPKLKLKALLEGI